MKRDIDLARQLLLDIEQRGADCSVSVLRTNPSHDVEERVRYHLRLLIDAGLLKEVDQTSNGVPCVRLTHEGHELVELARSDARWRDAKCACHDRTGGLSLTVIRGLLARWALAPYRSPPSRRPYAPPAWRHPRPYYSSQPAYRVEPYRVEPYRIEDRDWWNHDEADYVRVRPEPVSHWRRNGCSVEEDRLADLDFETSLPDDVI